MRKKEYTCPKCNKKFRCMPLIIRNDKDKMGMCGMNNDTWGLHLRIDKKNLYNKIPQEKKQAFLDNFRKGKTVKESYQLAGLNQEEGFAVLDLNIEDVPILRMEAK